MGKKQNRVRDLITRGLEQHQAGHLHEAKLIYEQALALDAQHPDAQHLLGVVTLHEVIRAIAGGQRHSASAVSTNLFAFDEAAGANRPAYVFWNA